jgi:hypothetical protein
MRARINEIPPAQEATWGAVLTTLLRTHPKEIEYHWMAHHKGEPGAYSVIDITEPGEDVEWLRAEIAAVVDLVNNVVRRDPLGKLVPIDVGLVEVLVD